MPAQFRMTLQSTEHGLSLFVDWCHVSYLNITIHCTIAAAMQLHANDDDDDYDHMPFVSISWLCLLIAPVLNIVTEPSKLLR